MIEEEIFKRSKPDLKRLIDYGFKLENNHYTYTKNILDNSFKIIVTITDKQIVKGKIYDSELEDEYLAFRIENQLGEFVSKIREQFIETLTDIKEKCFINETFIYNQSNRIAKLIKEKYNIEPEFLWKNDNKNAVFRNQDNKKWFGIIMNINKSKLTNEDKDIEVLNVKLDDKKIPLLTEKEGIYNAYHMNKKYWITISLDESLSDEEILKLIDESYSYTVTTNAWVVPANPKYYDIVNCFNNTNRITWKPSKSIHESDIVYIYISAPYSCIMFKCRALKNEQFSNYENSNYLDLELLEIYPNDKYPFKEIYNYGLKAIRGPRRMPKKLLDYMDKNN